MRVNGTEYRIGEPVLPFDTKWYNHKFYRPGVRYEVGVSIGSGFIACKNGWFHCRISPEIKIFNKTLKNRVHPEENVLCDKGYICRSCVYHIPKFGCLSRSLLARHESFNQRMKIFNVLSSRLHHNVSLHSYCFHAV